MMLQLSTTDVVPELQAKVKKLKGTRPQRTKTGNLGCELGKIFVKTKVSAPMMTKGFNNDHNTPNDMLRYRTLKSFWIRLLRRNA